jgi:hypothetical protein
VAVYRENNTVCIIYFNCLLTICILYDIIYVKKDNLKHARTCMYNINYHIVCSVKYRRKMYEKFPVNSCGKENFGTILTTWKRLEISQKRPSASISNTSQNSTDERRGHAKGKKEKEQFFPDNHYKECFSVWSAE